MRVWEAKGRQAKGRQAKEGGAAVDDGWEIVQRRKAFNRGESFRSNNTGWRLGSTFLFRNFPEDCGREELWFRFSEVGKVEDLFLPAKRDVRGSRFGFVRLSKGGKDEEMLEKLNKIWIGSYKIRAFIPRHERKVERPGDTRSKMSVARPKPSSVTFPTSRRAEGVLYSEALKGERDPRKITGGETTKRDTVVNFQSNDDEESWVKGAFTGLLKKDYSWKEHGEELRSEVAGSLRLSDLGGNMLLLQSENEKDTKEILAGFDIWAEFWFEWRRPWELIDVYQRRDVWTRWQGVPLQAWSERFFGIGSSQFGRMIEMHEITKNRQRLDEAFVKVSTGFDPIDRVLDCRINGASFRIRVEEVRCAELDAQLQQSVEAGLDSESEWESEVPADDFDDDDSVEAVEEKVSDISDGEGSIEGVFADPNSRQEFQGAASAEIASPQKDVLPCGFVRDTFIASDGFPDKGESNKLTRDSQGSVSGPEDREFGLNGDGGPEFRRLDLSTSSSGPGPTLDGGNSFSTPEAETQSAREPSLSENKKEAERLPGGVKAKAKHSRAFGNKEAAEMGRKKGNKRWKKAARASRARSVSQGWSTFIQDLNSAEKSGPSRRKKGEGSREGGEWSSLDKDLGKEGVEFGRKLGILGLRGSQDESREGGGSSAGMEGLGVEPQVSL